MLQWDRWAPAHQCDRRCRRRLSGKRLFEALEKTLPARPQRHFGEISPQVEHAVREGALRIERSEHPLLNRVFGDEIQHRDGVLLVLSPGARDALLEFGGIPRQVAVDHDAGVLEIEAHAAGVGAEEDAAIRIVLEKPDLGAPFLLRNRSRVPRKADTMLAAKVPDELEHPLPFGKHDHLHIGCREHLVEDAVEFLEFGARAVVAIEDIGRVAAHPHDAQLPEEFLLLLGRQRAAFRQGHELGHDLLVRRVVLALLGSEFDEEVPVGAAGQLFFDLALAAFTGAVPGFFDARRKTLEQIGQSGDIAGPTSDAYVDQMIRNTPMQPRF
ncbi:MAG TPA: hypothetical protein VHE61_18055 [Opitutaceae bacterium]|nr:hypothetical protein [Opitutaceae bacterium]